MRALLAISPFVVLAVWLLGIQTVINIIAIAGSVVAVLTAAVVLEIGR